MEEVEVWLADPSDLRPLREACAPHLDFQQLWEKQKLLPDPVRRIRLLIAVYHLDPGPQGREAYDLAFELMKNMLLSRVKQMPSNRVLWDPAAPAPVLVPALKKQRLVEQTPIRLDVTHSLWSDIFFLALEDPRQARVLNFSADIYTGNTPCCPLEASLERLETPNTIVLQSLDLKETVSISSLSQLFDYRQDGLGLLKAAVVASGLVPLWKEQRNTEFPSFKLVSEVKNIPKGSRFAVSTSLLVCLVTLCMRASGQLPLTGTVSEAEYGKIVSRALLGEWLGGSGGGFQDTGSLVPGLKQILGQPESILPQFKPVELNDRVRMLQDSLIVCHLGLCADVGPILQTVCIKYILKQDRSARASAAYIYSQIVELLEEEGDGDNDFLTQIGALLGNAVY
jgi:hypothetical protein